MGKARRKNEKDVTSDDKVYLQEDFLQCLAVEMELGELVNLPTGVLAEEWIASNTVAFFEHINLIYGTISEFCTMSGCSEMIGPGNKLYLWTDERGKRSKVPAPQYIDYVMTYMQKTLNDESIFPTKADKDFPSTFEMFTRKIYRLLFHVLAHIYHMHFNEIVILDLHKHLNCIFAHLILFNQQFNLIDNKELEALNDLSIALKLIPDNQQEQMQITPEPPTSLNLSNSIEQYLDTNLNNNKDLNELSNTQQQLDLQNQHHLNNLQTSNSFNQEITQSTNQRKKHSRQHSYTASSQTVSSPTNYIKRFISSFSPNNQQQQINSSTIPSTATTTNLNQNSAINEEDNSQQTNITTTQFKNPFSIKNDDDHLLKDCDQENQKIILNNFNQQQQSKKDTTTINKTHKYQNSTPIFFSSSFFSKKLNQDELNNQNNQDENDVQLNDKLVIKENTKLLNSDQEQFTRRTTSASVYLTQQSINETSIFTTTNLNENLNEDYSLDDQSTPMSFNQQTTSDLDQSNQMDIKNNFEEEYEDYETNNQFNQKKSDRKFCTLELDVNNELDHQNDNLENNLTDNHRNSSNRRNVCAFTD